MPNTARIDQKLEQIMDLLANDTNVDEDTRESLVQTANYHSATRIA